MQVLLLSAILACGQASRLGLPDTTSAHVMPFYGIEAQPGLSEEKDRRAVEGATGVSERLALAGVYFETRTAARLESVADSWTFCFGVLDGGTRLRIRPVHQRQPFGLATEPTGLDVASISGLQKTQITLPNTAESILGFGLFSHTPNTSSMAPSRSRR
ncbi:hypothetical protein CCHR01_00081 [Colletotrichum chrysophilum]|uniref:Uncharacterized protein n=1 Tax=Colletotrichum chrysophilum TaxID=1836956 RepID=A0AAD9B1L2_9PEZI|nr:hypothetical protein CCHR01_00081 [Colletotrichum chrysophilum]